MAKKILKTPTKPTRLTGKSTRRRFLAGTAAAGAGLAVSGPLILIPGKAKASEKIVWVGWGGSTQAVQQESFIKPFTKETGIEVISASGPNRAKIKAMVDTGNVEWDLVNMMGATATGLAKEGLLETIDSDLLAKWRGQSLQPDWIKDWAVGWYYWSGGIGYDPKRHPMGKHPRSWPDFWNADKFPGRRGLRPRVNENLELALMADGVKPKDLYPLDVERAFKSLDRIKPHVAKWIKATSQTITLIQNNEVDFDLTYSARVESAKASGISIELVYDSLLCESGLMGIPKGSKNKSAAMKLIDFFMREKPQKAWCENRIGYGPQNTKALAALSPALKAKLPSADDPSTAWVNIDWWGDHYGALSERFKEWLIT